MGTAVWAFGGLVALAVSVISFPLAHDAAAEDARVLPAGRSRFGFVYGQSAAVSETYDDQGNRVSITSAYNIDLSSTNLKTFDNQFNTLVKELNSQGLHYDASKASDPNSQGISITCTTCPLLGDALNRGDLGVNAEAHKTQYVLSMQHGVTDQLSLGFGVPLIHVDVETSKGITGDNTTANIYNAVKGRDLIPGIGNGLDFLATSNIETLQALLVSKGYSRFENSTQTGFGDAVLGGRYNYFKTPIEDVISSAQLGISVPTGALKSPGALTQVDLGNGDFELAMANIENYSPIRWLTFSNSINYTYRLPSSRSLRVRSSPDDFLPDSLTEQQVSMKLGDKYWTNLGVAIKLPYSISLTSSYEWYWKRIDHYSGSRTGIDYTYLSQDTQSSLQTLQFGAGVSSISSFLQKSFPLPGDFSINYYIPTAGVNSIYAPYGTAELAVYF